MKRPDWLALRMAIDRRHGMASRRLCGTSRCSISRIRTAAGRSLRQREPSDRHGRGAVRAEYCRGEARRQSSAASLQVPVETQKSDGTWETTSRAALGSTGAKKVNPINVHWGTAGRRSVC